MSRQQPEFHSIVVLSTAHLTEEDAGEFTYGGWLKRGSHGDGNLMRVPFVDTDGTLDEQLEHEPTSIADCLRWAYALTPRPAYILFDRDGPEMEGLPTYEW